jgi:patatin-like phospholipase/acyl hydrolase
MEQDKSFRILSIDGGGIRGIFPAKYLMELEARLSELHPEKPHLYQHFDLIAGTSTGGIIALALALGIPAERLYNLYRNHAKEIFGGKKNRVRQILSCSHDRCKLEELIRSEFSQHFNGLDPRLGQVKTHVCIPIYDLMEGRPSVLKDNYHPIFVRDFHIPAYMVALATSAAPTFFDPYSVAYPDLRGNTQSFNHKVDGGVFANNPTLLSIVEAQKAFGKRLSDLKVLSLGTGHFKFADGCARKRWGLLYWLKRKRIIDLFMQGQSQQVENLISLMHKGIGRLEPDNFMYMRVTTELDKTCLIELDEHDPTKLDKLAEKAFQAFQLTSHEVIKGLF